MLMLDAEFTVTEGPHIRRKFWQTLTVSGGKVDENGVSIGARITKSTLRAMIDSALGLDPEDMSEATKAKRILRGFADLSGITFVAKIKVETATTRPTRTRTGSTMSCCRPRPSGGRSWTGRPCRRGRARGGRRRPRRLRPQAHRRGDRRRRRRARRPAWGQGAAAGKPVEASKPAGGSTPAWLNS